MVVGGIFSAGEFNGRAFSDPTQTEPDYCRIRHAGGSTFLPAAQVGKVLQEVKNSCPTVVGPSGAHGFV
jgi:hypothetical protein